MTRALVDTSVFIAEETGRALDSDQLPQGLAASVVTIAELRVGVLAAIDSVQRAQRLATLRRAERLAPWPVDDDVAEAWAQLRVRLRDAGRRMPVNDSWIAATALAAGVPILTQDEDYDNVPGLAVIKL